MEFLIGSLLPAVDQWRNVSTRGIHGRVIDLTLHVSVVRYRAWHDMHNLCGNIHQVVLGGQVEVIMNSKTHKIFQIMKFYNMSRNSPYPYDRWIRMVLRPCQVYKLLSIIIQMRCHQWLQSKIGWAEVKFWRYLQIQECQLSNLVQKGCFKLRRWRSRRMKKSSEHEATPRLAELSGD